jgi:mannitol-1-phosphate/altronate dehydrogenase
MNSVDLNQNNLKNISSLVKVPNYRRENLKTAMVHIGLGHFHRAHQAVYVDDLLRAGLADTGFFEINLVPDREGFAKTLKKQDYLYSLVAKDPQGGEDVRIIGSILGYLCAPEDPKGAIRRIGGDETELVSLTVTEKGYYYDTAAEDLDWNNPDIVRDSENPGEPKTTIGYLAAALRYRYENSKKPVTLMSCDNFPSNGEILKKCLLSFFGKTGPEIIPWIESSAAFPVSMIDRITPSTGAANIRYVEEKYGIRDSWTVCCEDYRQWVLENNFKSPVPPYARAGVQLTADVEPYELMKIRLLNGAHSALAYLSYLMGFRDVAPAISDPQIQAFIRKMYMEEITRTLPPVEGIDLGQYKDTLVSRFSNVHIGDAILRLAMDGSKKIPNFIVPPLLEMAEKGWSHDAVVMALAGWARFLQGTDEQGAAIPIEDPGLGNIGGAAKEARQHPERFLTAIGVQGLEPAKAAELGKKFAAALDKLYQQGARAALEEFIRTSGRGW